MGGVVPELVAMWCALRSGAQECKEQENNNVTEKVNSYVISSALKERTDLNNLLDISVSAS